MDKISAIKTYVKVVESNSFTGTAEVLHTSTVHVTRMGSGAGAGAGCGASEPDNASKQAY